MKISQSQTAGRCVVNFTKGPEMSLVEEFHALSWQQSVEPPRDQEIFGIYFNFSRLQTRSLHAIWDDRVSHFWRPPPPLLAPCVIYFTITQRENLRLLIGAINSRFFLVCARCFLAGCVIDCVGHSVFILNCVCGVAVLPESHFYRLNFKLYTRNM